MRISITSIQYQLSRTFRKKGFIVFVISVFIAFFFWILFALGDTYTTNLPFTVSYQNIPADKIATQPLPNSIYLKVETKGWNILSVKLSGKKYPVIIDIGNYAQKGILLTSTLKNSIEFRKFQDFHILNISPDSLVFHFENLVSKKIPVIPIIDISFLQQYGQAGPLRFNPKKVELQGPESVILSIDTVFTKAYQFNNISKDIKNLMELDLSKNPLLRSKDSKILLEIPVEKFTEKKILMDIGFSATADNNIQLIPSKAEVTFQLPMSQFNSIDSNFIRVYIKPDAINPAETKSLKVYVESSYPFLKNLKVDPEYISYVIKNN